jgi:hypothetical protein
VIVGTQRRGAGRGLLGLDLSGPEMSLGAAEKECLRHVEWSNYKNRFTLASSSGGLKGFTT